MTPITVLDVAIAHGAKRDEKGCINGSEFDRLGLPICGGCEICSASIAAYNACPGRYGYLRCKACIAEDGFASVDAFDKWCKEIDEEDAA